MEMSSQRRSGSNIYDGNDGDRTMEADGTHACIAQEIDMLGKPGHLPLGGEAAIMRRCDTSKMW